MEKTIKWEPIEGMQMQQIEQEKTQALAQIGALMMDLETAKKNLDTANEKYKAAIKQALATRGINQLESVRPFSGGITVIIPDQPEVRANGGA